LAVVSELDPLNPAPHIARGLILNRLGLLAPAIDALEAAVALAPDAPDPIRFLAYVLCQTTRSREADAALRTALELDPGNPVLMNDRAIVLTRLHRHAEAVSLLRDVIRKNGPHASILCNLASSKLYLGFQDEAVELAWAAIALDLEAVMPRRALANTLPYQDGVTGTALLRVARNCAAAPAARIVAVSRQSPGPGSCTDRWPAVRDFAHPSGRLADGRGV
jgi:Flp pilus assembly protein TadD